MEATIQILQSDNIAELNELISVFETVFEMNGFVRPDQRHLQKLLKKEDFIAIVAKKENRVIGGLTLYVLHRYYANKPLAYLYDLAVLTEYQRQGIGRRLISFTNDYCSERGFEEVFVQADKVDDYALDFYRSTKPTNEEDAIHFYYRLHWQS